MSRQDLEKYKGYQLSVNEKGEFEASLGGEVALRRDTMKAIKEVVDRAAKKAFAPFKAWIKRKYYYGRGEDNSLAFKRVTVSSISPLTKKVYWKDEKGETGQDTPDNVFIDTPENEKLMMEAARLDKEQEKASKLASEAEEKVKRINVTKWMDDK